MLFKKAGEHELNVNERDQHSCVNLKISKYATISLTIITQKNTRSFPSRNMEATFIEHFFSRMP